jgi:hypothetical protein
MQRTGWRRARTRTGPDVSVAATFADPSRRTRARAPRGLAAGSGSPSDLHRAIREVRIHSLARSPPGACTRPRRTHAAPAERVRVENRMVFRRVASARARGVENRREQYVTGIARRERRRARALAASHCTGSRIVSRSCCSLFQSVRSTGSSLFRTSFGSVRTTPLNCTRRYVPESTTCDVRPDPEIAARNTASASH